MLKECLFRELYPGLKVTASFDRSESHQSDRWSDKMHHARSQAAESAGHLKRAVYHSFRFRAGMDDPTRVP